MLSIRPPYVLGAMAGLVISKRAFLGVEFLELLAAPTCILFSLQNSIEWYRALTRSG